MEVAQFGNSYNFDLLLWIWVIVFFILVEEIELIRAILRMKKHGIMQGVGSYHVSQWSRNFTFGMLYAFTVNFRDIDNSFFVLLRHVIVVVCPWIVCLFLIAEIIIFFKAKVKWSLKQSEGKNSGQKRYQET